MKKNAPKKIKKVVSPQPEKPQQKAESLQSQQPALMSSRETLYAITILVLFAILIYFFLTGGFGTVKDTAPEASKAIQKEPELQSSPVLAAISKNYTGTLPFLGNDTAPISIMEFGDYQCPFCQRFYSDVEKYMVSDYINKGKLKFYYKDFPQSTIHDKAVIAANAARCADEQNKFWEMHNQLYQNYGAWNIMQPSGAIEKFKEYAKVIDLDTEKFNSCLAQEKYKNDIDADVEDATKLGVIGTPTFLVSISKDKSNLVDLQKISSDIRGTVVQQDNYYVIIIEGNRGYDDFKRVFNLAE